MPRGCRAFLSGEACDCSSSGLQSLATQLLAARPVTWRGSGELLQVPWSRPLKGMWLVLDLWAGISGLCIALLALGFQFGFQFYALAAEKDPVARQCASSMMPSLAHVDEVAQVSVELL